MILVSVGISFYVNICEGSLVWVPNDSGVFKNGNFQPFSDIVAHIIRWYIQVPRQLFGDSQMHCLQWPWI